jgi:ribosome-associated protein
MARKSRRSRCVDDELVAQQGDRRSSDTPQAAEAPSRTQRKNESEELQKVGERLLKLRMEAIAALSLPEKLEDAIRDAKRISNFGAKRRQLQFIGKLMRQLDQRTLAILYAALRAEHGGSMREG